MQADSMKKNPIRLFVVFMVLLSPFSSCSNGDSSFNSGGALASRTNEVQDHKGSGKGDNEAGKGITLYIVTSREGCECFLDLCKELRAIGKDFATKYGDRIEVSLLDNDSDLQEVNSLREAHHLFLLPYVVLVDNRGDVENVIYVISGFEEAGPVLKDLEMWVEFSLSGSGPKGPSTIPAKGE